MPQPNILFVLIDDMGQRDLGCYGSTFYETPNIDRLARDGMLFTDAYAACPVCSPTRASILTGLYPATLGVTDWIDWTGRVHPARGKLVDVPYVKALPPTPGARGGIPNMASELSGRGYQTWHVGKWHLGGEGAWPEDRGFDRNIGGWTAGRPQKGYFSPWGFPTLEDGPEGEYLTDRLTDEAVKLIRGRDQQRPFYLNMWYYSVHTPIQAKQEKIEKYKAKAKVLGLDKIDPIIEGPAFPCEHKKHRRIQRRVVQSDVTYAAMIESLDEGIGRLLDALDDEGLAQNTIVVFTSDNGGLSTAEGSPTSNLPLAEGKGWMYEGGTREPLLIRWPEWVAAGSTSSVVVSSPDFLPTLLAAADLGGSGPRKPGATATTDSSLPTGRGARAEGEPGRPAGGDGTSFLPVLTDGVDDIEREAVFWHYPHYGNQGGTPGSSVRSGRYKLIEFFETGAVELYDLETDIAETNNLSETMPGVTAELKQLLGRWRESVEARIPAANTEFVSWPHRAFAGRAQASPSSE